LALASNKHPLEASNETVSLRRKIGAGCQILGTTVSQGIFMEEGTLWVGLMRRGKGKKAQFGERKREF